MPLFQKTMEARCVYCIYSRPLNDDLIVCPKRGVMSCGSACRKFEYDPLKRVPPRPVKTDFSGLKAEDFSLD